ncbi:hypothetical protein C8R44DRAFT_876776 [Mycena epipterygia]|nr:hypothetical protein C8R44DRAFT_876776 [Mycena epipterygia]
MGMLARRLFNILTSSILPLYAHIPVHIHIFCTYLLRLLRPRAHTSSPELGPALNRFGTFVLHQGLETLILRAVRHCTNTVDSAWCYPAVSTLAFHRPSDPPASFCSILLAPMHLHFLVLYIHSPTSIHHPAAHSLPFDKTSRIRTSPTWASRNTHPTSAPSRVKTLRRGAFGGVLSFGVNALGDAAQASKVVDLYKLVMKVMRRRPASTTHQQLSEEQRASGMDIIVVFETALRIAFDEPT